MDEDLMEKNVVLKIGKGQGKEWLNEFEHIWSFEDNMHL
jgi:hypothetical protein